MAERDRVTVVIVEDDPTFRGRFEQILTPSEGYSVLAAVESVADGIEAVCAADVDLLVVDLGLPDGDGIAVIREVAERHPDCAIMVVTVFGDEEHVVSAIEAGASGYLLKDSDPADFVSAVRDLLEGGSPVSPMVARLVLERLRKPMERAPVEAEGEESVQLSDREAQILTLVAKGFSFGDICSLLTITNNTVKTHVNRIYRKLAVHSRGQAVYEATRLGLIEL